MPRKQSRSFTDVELEFMQIIWERGEVTPDEINTALKGKNRNISPGSIRNVLSIMMAKKYITRRKDNKAYRYSAIIDKHSAQKGMVNTLLTDVFNGSESLVVATLLERDSLDTDELCKIKKLIQEHEERNGQ